MIETREVTVQAEQIEVVATSPPEPVTKSSIVPSPTPTVQFTPTITPTPDTAPRGVELPAPLYFFPIGYHIDEQAEELFSVWRLDPGDTQVRRVTSSDLRIVSVDVWSGDGRLAYITESGDLYIALPGQEPRLLYEAGDWVDQPLVVNSVAWSPDGTRLAYSVGYPKEHESFRDSDLAAQPTGLWILTLQMNRASSC